MSLKSLTLKFLKEKISKKVEWRIVSKGCVAIMPTAPAKPPATSSVANDMAEVTGLFLLHRVCRKQKKDVNFFTEKLGWKMIFLFV